MPPRKRKSEDYAPASGAKRRMPKRSCNYSDEDNQSEPKIGETEIGSNSEKSRTTTCETSETSTWKPPKTKRSNIEHSIGYVGAIVPPELKDFDFHEGEKRRQQVLRNGPYGPPVYDEMGYPLSYARLKRTTSDPRRYNAQRHWERIQRDMAKNKKIQKIMGREHCHNLMTQAAWQDRVARDLDIPFHTVDVPEYEEWRRRGFRLEPGELENHPCKQEFNRLIRLMSGSAFREESTS